MVYVWMSTHWSLYVYTIYRELCDECNAGMVAHFSLLMSWCVSRQTRDHPAGLVLAQGPWGSASAPEAWPPVPCPCGAPAPGKATCKCWSTVCCVGSEVCVIMLLAFVCAALHGCSKPLVLNICVLNKCLVLTSGALKIIVWTCTNNKQ